MTSASSNVAVNEGKVDDAGKEVSTYVKILLFGALANEARKICKGDRCYTEGSLAASAYQHETGLRVDLSVRAFKFERTQIGKRRPPREKGQELSAAAFAGPAERSRLGIAGRDDFEHAGGDPVPF
jgi:single-stranded DNA-binding protein